MEHLLRLAVASGLKFPIDDRIDFSVIPNNVFGIFVGVNRSDQHRLRHWPEQVHGCLGYWDPMYQTMDKQLIVDKIKKLAYESTWEDNRRLHFDHSIYVDLGASYLIYFMLQPVMHVNEHGMILEKSELFDNKTYGLIVTDGQHNKATYLPNVFPDKDWNFIRQSILDKASIVSGQVSFYAYECRIEQLTITDYFLKPIQKFINNNYHDFVPYAINQNKLIIDKTEAIRNLAMIYDLLQMDQLNYSLSNQVKMAIKNNVSYYQKLFHQHENYNRQASSFLLMNLYMIDPSNPDIPVIKNYLLGQLNLQDKLNQGLHSEHFTPIENNFELAQILLALIMVDPNNVTIIEEINTVPHIDHHLDGNAELDIFRYNWFSKLTPFIRNKIYKYSLINKIIKYIDTNPNHNETNYHVVEFEALSELHANITDIKTQYRIEKYLADLMIKLEKRRNKYGFYQFLNGQTRFDITGHVMSGWYALLRKQNQPN